MRISPISFNQHSLNQNFNGVKILDHSDNTDSDSLGVIVDIDYYNYYPFKDETQAEIEKNVYPLDQIEHMPRTYPLYSEYTGSKTTVMPPLSITKATYEALKKEKVSDEAIVKIFA